jgi:[acyl-carrier-protein] S-malonyltransferase
MAFAFFFPGQGSQSLHMMDGFNDISVVRHTFQEASDVLGEDLWAMINGDDAAKLNATVITQPLMLTAGVATWRAYQHLGGVMPAALAGHSLGEYTALVAAQSLDFATAIKLVSERAHLMQNAVPQGVGAMAAILGLSDADVMDVCRLAQDGGEVVEAVNFNAVGQVVIAGNKAAVETAMALAKEKGAKRALPLPVSVPSHCSLMKPAAEKLKTYLEGVNIVAPQIPVIHNVDVNTHQDVALIKDALVRQLYSPVLVDTNGQ